MRRSSLPRLRFTLVASVLALFAVAFGAGVPPASAAVQDRIAAAISNESHTAIPGSVHPSALLATDLGPTPAATPLVGMSIRFSMTAAQQAALDQLLADLQNPSSPSFHQWLTPTQYAAQFGLSSADIAKVTAWLTSQGFTLTGVANGGTFITFDGTVAQAQTAFSTSIHNLSINGQTHFANITSASVPSALANVVTGITGLHNFHPRAHVHTSVVNPKFTSSVSGNHYVAPGDLYTIYDINPLLTNGITGAGVGTGANCHSVPTGTICGDIAVTGQVDINTADVVAFRSASGLSTTVLPTTFHVGGDPGAASSCDPDVSSNCPVPNQSDLDESSIDVEWAGATAPSANILFVNGPDVFNNSMTQAIDADFAPIVTTSYGDCEASWGSMELNLLNALFKQGNAQGQTILAAAADVGATDCDTGPLAMEGLAVDFPGSSPYVTSMGGTMFSENSGINFWNSNSSSSVDYAGSATSYIPEVVWNDFSYDEFGGGGGGVSAFFTKPAWQQGTGVPADASRDVPDLALNASDNHDSFLYCVNVALGDSCTIGFRIANNDLDAAGGTSFDSQIFGGMLALVEQKIGSRIGNANRTIYALANNALYYTPGATILTLPTVVFNDVTSGNNDMPCTTGTTNCPNGASIGYSAGSGFDLASGWGSPNVYNLALDWNLVTPLGLGSLGANVSATTVTASSASVAAGASLTLTATVTGSVGTPTGAVQFLVNNAIVGSGTLNASGVATYSYTASCSNLGQLDLSASYTGDTNYQGSKGPALTVDGSNTTSNGSFIVTPLIINVTAGTCPTFTLAPAASTVTVVTGGTPVSVITVTPVNGFSGTIAFSATAVETTGYAPGFSFSATSVTIPSSTTSTTLTLTGIVASLHLPGAPGRVDSGTMLAQQTPSRIPPTRRIWYATGPGVAIASLLLLTLPRRRRLGGLLLVALSIAIVGGAGGCASNTATATTGTTTSTNPYAGTYVVTVVGTSSSTTASTTVTFQIQ